MKKYKVGICTDEINILNKENIEILTLGCLECETFYANMSENFYEDARQVLPNLKKISNINAVKQNYDKIYKRK